jgi:hypothetical protein
VIADTEPTSGGALDINPGLTAQGHVSQQIEQVFTRLRHGKVKCKRLQLEADEFLLRDQFGNCYITYRAMLLDGEMYDVAEYFGKQLSHDKTIRTVREWKEIGPVLIDEVMDSLRESAFVKYGRTVLSILRARQGFWPNLVSSFCVGDSHMGSSRRAFSLVDRPIHNLFEHSDCNERLAQSEAILHVVPYFVPVARVSCIDVCAYESRRCIGT